MHCLPMNIQKNINCICTNNTANHFKTGSAIIRINTEGKSLIIKLSPSELNGVTLLNILTLKTF